MFFNCMLGFTLPCPFLLECNDIFFLDSAFIGGVLPELYLFVLFLLFHRIQTIPPTHPHTPIRDFLFPVPIVDSPRVLDCLLSLHRDISCFFPTLFPLGLIFLQEYWYLCDCQGCNGTHSVMGSLFLLCLLCVDDDQTFSAPLPTVLSLVFSFHLTSL